MSDSASALMVRLDVNQRQYAREMARMAQQTDRRLGDIERRFSKANGSIASRMAAMGKSFGGFAAGRGAGIGGIAGALGAYVSAQGARQLTDSATQITNALKVAGLEGEELTAVYDRLFASAQKNSAPIEALVTLYGRAAIVQNELKVSTEELLGFTDNVALALRVAGSDAQTASGALLQLSQALGAGVVRAEEFSSVQEGALPILQAAAAGIEEAGGSVARLRTLVNDGQVSSQAFFRGFEAGAHILEEMASGSVSTVSQGFIRLRNVLIDVAGDLDDGSGASRELSGALDELGDYIQSTDFSPLIRGALSLAGAIGGAIEYVHGLGAALGELTGANGVGTMLRGGRLEETIGERVGGAFQAAREGRSGNTEQDAALRSALMGRALEARGGTVVDVPARPRITLKDYPIEGEAKKGAGGRSGRRGGRGAGAERENDLEREIAQLQKRTAAVLAETNAMAGLNPLIDDYGFALEQARASHDLLTAAQEAGIAVTPELKEQIDTLAAGYANASVEANKLSDAQDDARARADEMRSVVQDGLKGFVTDLRNGTSAAEAFANVLDRIVDRMIDAGLDTPFGGSPFRIGACA